MKNILNVYEVASGQAISLPKTEIFNSRNVFDELKQNITTILAVRAVLGTGKYLGMMSMIGRDRTPHLLILRTVCGNALIRGVVSAYLRQDVKL
jgi:hypothetical protein